nr:Flp family type IVb pilin [Sphingomonas azotifigens]
MRALITLLHAVARANRGATAVEYGLILALIVLALISALSGLGSTTSQLWGNVSQKVQQAGQ